MADVRLAIAYVVRQEDSTLSGVVTTDRGGRTRFGIAEKFHPWIGEIGFYDDDKLPGNTGMSRDEAMGAAVVMYMGGYAMPLQIAAIRDQDVANKLLSLAVNDGLTYPVKWLQEAVGAIPDGTMGPATLAAVNKCSSQKVLAGLKEQAVLYYQDVVRQHPEEAVNLNGWIKRANA